MENPVDPFKGFEKEKWLAFPKYSKVMKVEENKSIVAFKIPVNSKFSEILNEDEMFQPKDVAEYYKANGAQIGAVIDLTENDNFYTAEDWGPDVKYERMTISGGGLPSDEICS